MKMLLATFVCFALLLGAAPAALGETKQHPSSNLPWAIGLAVIVVFVLAVLMMSLRRRMGRRREPGPFREGDSA